MNIQSACSGKLGILLIAGMFTTALYSAESSTTFLEAGKRFFVQTEGRDDYKPKIVECESSGIGLCLRDTRGNPANNPLEPYDGDTLEEVCKSRALKATV
ncbi:MAG: hypothetical protein U5R46_19845 [Gammaproteobacteria bacterium]|nr:hypothetical protein [Gammaproteobacteria bacterium]